MNVIESLLLRFGDIAGLEPDDADTIAFVEGISAIRSELDNLLGRHSTGRSDFLVSVYCGKREINTAK